MLSQCLEKMTLNSFFHDRGLYMACFKYKKIKEKDELEGKDLNTLKRIKIECHEHRLNYPRLRRKIEKYQKNIENNPN